MHHMVAARAVVGTGDYAVLLEVKGRSVRVKRRGMPDAYVPIEAAADVARFLMAAATAEATHASRGSVSA